MKQTGWGSLPHWLALLGLVLLSCTRPAAASGLQVSPVTLTLPADRNADGLWLSNSGDATLHAQVRVYVWTQESGEEKLQPTRDLAISPPMLELPPGGRQLVRVIRLGAPPQAGAEAAYRIVVDELPLQKSPAKKSGLQLVLRYSIPVFLPPSGPPPEAPVLRVRLDLSKEAAALEVANSGGIHAQIADLVFIDATGQRKSIAPGLLGYALPGQRMRWPLAHPSSLFDQGGTLKARINGEAEEQSLSLDSVAR